MAQKFGNGRWVQEGFLDNREKGNQSTCARSSGRLSKGGYRPRRRQCLLSLRFIPTMVVTVGREWSVSRPYREWIEAPFVGESRNYWPLDAFVPPRNDVARRNA